MAAAVATAAAGALRCPLLGCFISRRRDLRGQRGESSFSPVSFRSFRRVRTTVHLSHEQRFVSTRPLCKLAADRASLYQVSPARSGIGRYSVANEMPSNVLFVENHLQSSCPSFIACLSRSRKVAAGKSFRVPSGPFVGNSKVALS